MRDARSSQEELSRRVLELKKKFEAGDASLAYLACDCHDPDALAYTIVGKDMVLRDITYGELKAQSEIFARALSGLGVKPGDRVATLMGKSYEYLVSLLAIWRLGAVHVPLFTAFASPAVAMRLTRSNAKVVMSDETQLPKLQDTDVMPEKPTWAVITLGAAGDGLLSFHDLMAKAAGMSDGVSVPYVQGADGPIIHIYTSGTTGEPKAVLVPLKAVASFQAYGEFALDLGPDDIYWCAADPGWAYGLYFGILTSLVTGTRSILFEGGFSPEATWRVLEMCGVTNFAAAPTVYRALRTSDAHPPQCLPLRCASSAGEPLTPEVNEWALTALGVPVYDHYGQTEAGMLINNHHALALRHSIREGSMGHVMPGWSAVVLDENEDHIAPVGTLGRVAMELCDSPLAWFSGYLNDAEKSASKFAGEGRWYLTGDTARVDEEGYFHFSARDDDVIIMAGYRIGPFEVESVILTHPTVAECGVIAVPDEVRGEVIEAYVVLKSGEHASEALESEIQKWVKARFAAHAFPRKVHFIDQLPKTSSGKVQRFELRTRRNAELAVEKSKGG